MRQWNLRRQGGGSGACYGVGDSSRGDFVGDICGDGREPSLAIVKKMVAPISDGGGMGGELMVAYLVSLVVVASLVSVVMLMTVMHFGGHYMGGNGDSNRT